MLYQKSSDVYMIQKMGRIFAVSHPVSRHAMIDDFVFELSHSGIPNFIDSHDPNVRSQLQDARSSGNVLDRVLSKEDVAEFFVDEKTIRSKDLIDKIMAKFNVAIATAYRIVQNSSALGIIMRDGKFFNRNIMNM